MPWSTVYYHFRKFRVDWLWHLILRTLHAAERKRTGRNLEPSAAILDSRSVKTVEESAAIMGYDPHKKIGGHKRHLLVDTIGLPLSIALPPPMCEISTGLVSF
jgi:putative transposase